MPDPNPLAGKRICIDPGHPSEIGVGTQGKTLTEVGVAWTIARRLQTLLSERGATVKLTKSSEREFVKNRRRAEIANAFHADLLLRLHCDADAGRGIAVFYPDRQGTDKAGFIGPTPAVLAATWAIAPRFHHALVRALAGTPIRDRGAKSDIYTAVGAKQGALTGSIWSEVPVLLVEMVTLSHPGDEAFLRDPAGHERMATALADATVAAIGASG